MKNRAQPPQKWSYEEAAQLNIFNNPLITTSQGHTFSQQQSPYSFTNIYYIAELFDNFSQPAYNLSPRVRPGNKRTTENLTTAYTTRRNRDKMTEANWNELIQAIERVPDLLAILKQGTPDTHQHKDWIAHLPHPSSPIPEQIYQVIRSGPNTYFQSYRLDSSRTVVTEKLSIIPGHWGANSIFRKLTVTNAEKETNTPYCRGQMFIPYSLATTSLPPPTKYISEYHKGSFKEAAKAYRTHQPGPPPSALAKWTIPLIPHQKPWDRLILSIYHTRTESNIRDLIWKLLINKAYMGPFAASYLQHSNRNGSKTYAIQAHGRCLCSSETVHYANTPKHRFWECEKIQQLKNELNNIFHVLKLDNPLTAWEKLPFILDPQARDSVNGIISTDLILAYISTVWSQYHHEQRTYEAWLKTTDPQGLAQPPDPHGQPRPAQAQLDQRPPDPQEQQRLAQAQLDQQTALTLEAQIQYDLLFSTYQTRMASMLVAKIRNIAIITPHHAHTLHTYLNTKGQPNPARALALAPPHKIIHDALSPGQILTYQKYWGQSCQPHCPHPCHDLLELTHPLLCLKDKAFNLTLTSNSYGRLISVQVKATEPQQQRRAYR